MSKIARIIQNVRRNCIGGIRTIHSVQQCNVERKFESMQPNLCDSSRLKYECFKNYCQSASVSCWKCGKERKSITDLFCDKCNIVQNPYEHNNYFKVFNLSERFEVDLKSLTNKYRQMQSMLHPDKFSNRSNEEKVISEKYSSLVNKAYSTLQVPLKRALHMLSLHNEKIDETNEVSDKEFLMEIMELNEEIDDADTPEKLKNLNEKNKKILGEITLEISKHFGDSDVQKAKISIIKMKYFDSINGRINNLLRERGILD